MQDIVGTKTLLIVDDEEFLANSLGKFFIRKGYNVITANSGKEAIQKANEAQKVDLIITDMRMPNGGGDYVIQNASTIPVIVCTGFSEFESQSLLKMGAKAIFSKPVEKKVLLEKVQSLTN